MNYTKKIKHKKHLLLYHKSAIFVISSIIIKTDNYEKTHTPYYKPHRMLLGY